MYKLTGKLQYEPHRQDFKKSFKARPLIVQFPYDDLSAYYRWFIERKYGLKLQAPMFGCHVTIVRGDEPGWKAKNWKKYEGHKLTVEVSPLVYKQRIFWALPIRCQRAHEIRHELGLRNFHNLHLTIGREYPEDANRYWSQRQMHYLQEQAIDELGNLVDYTTPEGV